MSLPIPRIEGDGSRVLHVPSQQCRPHGAVQFGYFDLIQVAFHPVNVPCYPVHCQTLRGGQAVLDYDIVAGQG